VETTVALVRDLVAAQFPHRTPLTVTPVVPGRSRPPAGTSSAPSWTRTRAPGPTAGRGRCGKALLTLRDHPDGHPDDVRPAAEVVEQLLA
jgi:hypothetical protein